jgi:small-conductance mechanosensitive channel
MNQFETIQEWTGIAASVIIQIIISLFLIILYFVVRKLVSGIVHRHGRKHKMGKARAIYILKLLDTGMVMLLIIVVSFVWGVTVQGLSLYFASLFTIIGIGFVAQWSILSNITASIILFFYYPFHINSMVKVFDGDNSIVGKVVDITIFSVKIRLENNEFVSYPNNLLLQKPIIEIRNKIQPDHEAVNT